MLVQLGKFITPILLLLALVSIMLLVLFAAASALHGSLSPADDAFKELAPVQQKQFLHLPVISSSPGCLLLPLPLLLPLLLLMKTFPPLEEQLLQLPAAYALLLQLGDDLPADHFLCVHACTMLRSFTCSESQNAVS